MVVGGFVEEQGGEVLKEEDVVPVAEEEVEDSRKLSLEYDPIRHLWCLLPIVKKIKLLLSFLL